MGFVHNYLKSIKVKDIIMLLWHIETQDIGKAGTPPAFDTDAETILFRDVFFPTNLLQLFHCSMRQTYGRRGSCFKYCFHK